VDDNVYDLLAEGCDYDIMGEFYSEFLSYVGGDQQALGIVLTPRHITELMVDLVNTNVNTTLIDTCAGTGGFLVSGMTKMLKLAKGNKKKEAEIKQKQLIGVELQSHMYALAVSNMLIRGDGKANMILGSCFMPDSLKKSIIDMQPTAGTINPPYAQGGEKTELHFADNMLNLLAPNSLGAIILPISCAIKPSKMKKELLKKHTLEAVMSMPVDLFNKVGAVTCIMIFRAKVPHQSEYKTWFGYWRDDGFTKTKNEGRADVKNKWAEIKKNWVSFYNSKKVEAENSVLKKVTAYDEWCAETYMETDYSKLSNVDFIKTLKTYVAWGVLND
jgi:type I restriction-modification system DNA methylase subunit